MSNEENTNQPAPIHLGAPAEDVSASEEPEDTQASEKTTVESAAKTAAGMEKEDKPGYFSVQEGLREAIAKSSQEVLNRLLKNLTDREVDRRVDLLDKALAKRKDFVKAYENIRAESMVNPQGVKIPGNFTPEQWKKKQEAKQALDNFDRAFELSLAGDEEKGLRKLSELMGKSN